MIAPCDSRGKRYVQFTMRHRSWPPFVPERHSHEAHYMMQVMDTLGVIQLHSLGRKQP